MLPLQLVLVPGNLLTAHRHVISSTHRSTTENVAIFAWLSLTEVMAGQAHLLYEVRIHETEKNIITYRGERG